MFDAATPTDSPAELREKAARARALVMHIPYGEIAKEHWNFAQRLEDRARMLETMRQNEPLHSAA